MMLQNELGIDGRIERGILNSGDIELHAQNTTLLTENSLTSARSTAT